ncbi:YjbH domain-containing protein [Phaeovulum sp. W22_SRMD_FR3]|uniref:YjbH domain-containing protein n=1 Tax=Phaeovulum sp. W22_SRMD_FR3 TaxID=3240274 RepID=UPI003F99403E
MRRIAKRIGARSLGGLALALLGGAPLAVADPLIGVTRNSFGMPGLIDMPSAEARPDGTLGATVFNFNGTTRGTFSFQIVPRLSASLRYSLVPGLMPGNEDLYDRSFDMQFQLMDEGPIRPAIAIGLRDIVGTGVYSSEYIVATKSIGPRLRVTGGLGWGRLGSTGAIGSFGAREPYDFSSTGGKFNAGQWFKGDFAPFAGVAYMLNDKVTLKAEYSSDGYDRETAVGEMKAKSQLNFAVDYRFNDNVNVTGYYMYGNKVGLQFNLNIDPRKPPFPSGIETAPQPVLPRPSRAADPEGWAGTWSEDPTARPAIQNAAAAALAKDGQIIESMSLSATRAEVRVSNETYGAEPQALGHTARILTRALPPSVETIVITPVTRGIPASSITFRRSDLESMENGNSYDLLPRIGISDSRAAGTEELHLTEGLFPRFKWALTPYAEASIFDPDDPFRIDLGLTLAGSYEFRPGLVLSGAINQRAIGNLSDSTRVSDSTVYHVRSDLVEYQKRGDLAIQNLQLAWYGHPAENVYSRVTVGLLERMYGGISTEILWKPVDSRLALGVELNYVQQRGFDQRFDFRDYRTATGHASVYYDIGAGFNTELDVGRYLAKDWGATLTVDREFSNGWRVGAFATVTDMSADDFGEGSFDKGIRVTIPVAWTTGKPSVNKVNTVIRPLNRDGGARLDVDGRLYDTIRQAHTGDLYDSWGRFWR